MNILAAPNTMKGSLSADAFSRIIENAFRSVSPVFNIRRLPIADGGDFTGPILNEAFGAKVITVSVCDPLMRPVEASFGVAGKTAVIEMASASGMGLLSSDELNPEKTTTYGTGQLLKRALDLGCERIILGAGGSATVDGGIGLLDALGFCFFDKMGKNLPGLATSLHAVHTVELPSESGSTPEIIILCDVNNPLLGDNGAARVFGPQKGAGPEMVVRLEEGLNNWAEVLESLSGKNLRDVAGMGAAGGISTALVTFFNATPVTGAQYIFDILNLDRHLEWAEWVITGEGKIDEQSFALKAPMALAARAHDAGKPVIALAGSIEGEVDQLFDAAFSIVKGPMSLEESILNASELVYSTARQVAGLLLRSHSISKKLHDHYSIIYNCISQNDLKKAHEFLSGIDEGLAVHWYLLGLLYKKEQNWGGALNSFLRTLEIDPGNPYAQSNIDMIKSILRYTNPHISDP
jgi:glycerate 2-kinase